MLSKIIIGSDHGGFELKAELIKHLESKGIDVTDVGCDGSSVDYPDVAQDVAKPVAAGEFERGIVVCGSGIGISIACNKVKGIRCALVHDHYTAKMCRLHNNANVVALGGRTTGIEIAKEIIDTYVATEFEGGRHERRVNKIHDIEA